MREVAFASRLARAALLLALGPHATAGEVSVRIDEVSILGGNSSPSEGICPTSAASGCSPDTIMPRGSISVPKSRRSVRFRQGAFRTYIFNSRWRSAP